MKCVLCVESRDGMVLLLSDHKQTIGLGRILSNQGNSHLKPLPPGYLNVSIEYIKPGTKPQMASSFDGEELEAGQFTVWPQRLTKSATH